MRNARSVTLTSGKKGKNDVMGKKREHATHGDPFESASHTWLNCVVKFNPRRFGLENQLNNFLTLSLCFPTLELESFRLNKSMPIPFVVCAFYEYIFVQLEWKITPITEDSSLKLEKFIKTPAVPVYTILEGWMIGEHDYYFVLQFEQGPPDELPGVFRVTSQTNQLYKETSRLTLTTCNECHTHSLTERSRRYTRSPQGEMFLIGSGPCPRCGRKASIKWVHPHVKSAFKICMQSLILDTIHNELGEIKDRLEVLETEIKYIPGMRGYEEAKESFEAAVAESQSVSRIGEREEQQAVWDRMKAAVQSERSLMGLVVSIMWLLLVYAWSIFILYCLVFVL